MCSVSFPQDRSVVERQGRPNYLKGFSMTLIKKIVEMFSSKNEYRFSRDLIRQERGPAYDRVIWNNRFVSDDGMEWDHIVVVYIKFEEYIAVRSFVVNSYKFNSNFEAMEFMADNYELFGLNSDRYYALS